MQPSILQSKGWTLFKSSFDWKVHKIDDITILERKLPFGKSLLYAPEVSISPSEISKISKNSKISDSAIFFRLEILNDISPDYIAALERNEFQKSFEEMQPEHRQIIDLSEPIENILAQMKPKGRYNINVAKRHGVRVTAGDIENFYKLYVEAAKRDKFSPRSKKYFDELTKHLLGETEIFVAHYNHEPVAAALVTFYKNTASYLYGGSSNVNRQVMAPSLLHFKIMEEAKQRGMKHYDLLAIAPDEKSHKFAGLRRFKQQFGGRQVDSVGSWDLVFKPVWYIIYRIIESIRRR